MYAMNNFVWGIDLVEEQFLGSCGIPSRPYMAKKPVKCIAEFSVNAQKTGTLLNVDWVDVSPLSQSLIGQGPLSESHVTQACCRGCTWHPFGDASLSILEAVAHVSWDTVCCRHGLCVLWHHPRRTNSEFPAHSVLFHTGLRAVPAQCRSFKVSQRLCTAEHSRRREHTSHAWRMACPHGSLR